MDAMQTTLVKYALALYRHRMGFRGAVGGGSGFDTLKPRNKAEVLEIVEDRVARDSDFVHHPAPDRAEPYDQVEKSMLARLGEAWSPGRPDRSGSFDIRVSFRRPDDGVEWGEVAFIDRDTGKLIPGDGHTLVLDSADALDWMLGRITEEGWQLRKDQEHRGG